MRFPPPKLFLLLIFLFIESVAWGQKIKFFGKFVIEKGDMDKAVIYIEKNGKPVKTLYPNGQKFEFECDINADYLFKFEKPGYITKKISINSTVAQDRAEEGFDPYKFNVYLFPQVEGVNTVIFNQPVGKIMYKSDLDDIGFDTDYTKSIEAEMKEFEAAYKEKEKEAIVPPQPMPVAVAEPKPPAGQPKTIPQTQGGPLQPKQEFETQPKQSPPPVALAPVIEEDKSKKIAPVTEQEKPKKVAPVMDQDFKKYSTGSEEAERRKALLAAEDDERRRKMLAVMSGDEVRRNDIAGRIELEKRMQYPQPKIPSYTRTENTIKESRREITEIILTSQFTITTYRKVQCDFGGIYYFRNEMSISKWMFDNAFSTMLGG